jgi:hypothetical protein
MLIKAYGINWNPDIIDWTKSSLIGEIQYPDTTPRKKYNINFWEAKGIYTLHSDFKTIYVGKAFKTSIGKRLCDHLSDRLAGRWDMLSWYSVSAPRFTQYDVSDPGVRQLTADTVVKTLEALAILVADPALNRKRESFRDAYEATQFTGASPKAIRAYLEEILKKL